MTASQKRKEELSQALAVVNSQIGMPEVKRQFNELVAVALFEQERRERNPEAKGAARMTHHAFFLGNPGTGKSTIAEQLGRAYKALGVTEKDSVHTVDAVTLKGEFIGQTGPKVEAEFDKAKGGVFFVDEIGQLINDARRGDNYANEALLKLMNLAEKNRESTVFVFAGYPQAREAMLEIDPGMASRFPNTVNFPDYTPKELAQIGERFAEGFHMKMSPSAKRALESEFARLERVRANPPEGKQAPAFGNAREVRNIVEGAFRNHAVAVNRAGDKYPKGKMDVLDVEDFPGYRTVSAPVGRKMVGGSGKPRKRAEGRPRPVPA